MKSKDDPPSEGFPPVPPGNAAGFPILAITGPRQSGKTTLSRLIAPELP
jgi:polynucleotide 5'-kinase involved in rRNA processing